MTVFVHKLEGQGAAFFGRIAAPDPWYVLTADTDDELHAFAARLGLTPVMFRAGRQALPGQKPAAAHYAITLGERDRAVGLGAQQISRREADRKTRQRAAGLG
jgi:phosphoglycolate phosphatase-like HAD superfamily hydrolase